MSLERGNWSVVVAVAGGATFAGALFVTYLLIHLCVYYTCSRACGPACRRNTWMQTVHSIYIYIHINT